MKTIRLTGKLGKEFGRSYRLEVHSPAEAVRALVYQLPGFEAALEAGEYKITKTYGKTRDDIGLDGLTLGFGKATGMTISPVVGGGKEGTGKFLLGAAILVGAFVFAPVGLAGAAGTGMFGANLGATAFSAFGSTVTYGHIAQMGLMMALQGVSQMLAPDVKTEERETSSMIDGAGNLYEQGNSVPLVFGQAYVGSVVISGGISTEEVPVDDD